jgi:hypothetical protein
MQLDAVIINTITRYLPSIDIFSLAQSAPTFRYALMTSRWNHFVDLLRHKSKYTNVLHSIGRIFAYETSRASTRIHCLIKGGRTVEYHEKIAPDDHTARRASYDSFLPRNPFSVRGNVKDIAIDFMPLLAYSPADETYKRVMFGKMGGPDGIIFEFCWQAQCEIP